MKNCIKNVNENMTVFIHIFMHIFTSFYEICFSFALLISYMVFIPFNMAILFFWTASSFPNIDGPKLTCFFLSSTGSWPQVFLKTGLRIFKVLLYFVDFSP